MLKSELIACAGNIIGSKTQAQAALAAILSIINDSLAKGETVAIPGFGNFKVVVRKARKGRNPQTGAEIDIPVRKDVKFTPDSALASEIGDYTL